MAIQNRRGNEKDFDASKMLPGEFGFTTDGTRKVYAAFGPGDVKEIAFKDEIPSNNANITDKQIQDAVNNYMDENKVAAGATQEQAEQIEKNKKDISEMSEQKADKDFVISVFEQLKQLIQNGEIDSAVALLDSAILDLSTLA